jgi:signal transduction histidine kinase
MGEMASALAHELNQPLAAISNYMKGSRRLLAGSTDPNAGKISSASASRRDATAPGPWASPAVLRKASTELFRDAIFS